MAIRNEREGPPDKGGGRGEFDGPSSAPRPTQSASEKVFSDGIPFADIRQPESPAPCERGCSASGYHSGAEDKCHCSETEPSSSTEAGECCLSFSLPADDSLSEELAPGRNPKSPRNLDASLPPGPLVYDSGWISTKGFKLRVALGAGPPNPDLHAFLSRLLLLSSSAKHGESDGN